MANQKLLTSENRTKLLRNGAKRSSLNRPIVKFFDPTGSATWLISEMDPEDNDLLFGLCDLGAGCPEMGSVRLSEIKSVKGKFGIGIERDRWFTADKTLVEYADEARAAGRISA